MNDDITYDQQYRATACTSGILKFVFNWSTTLGTVNSCTMYSSEKNQYFEFDRENLQKLSKSIHDFLYNVGIDVSLSDKIVRSYGGTITVKRELTTVNNEYLVVWWRVESKGNRLIADPESLRLTQFDATGNKIISEWRITSRWAYGTMLTAPLDGVPELNALIKKLIKVMKPQTTTPSLWNRIGKRIGSMFSSQPYSVANTTTKDDYII